jgi:maltooligosyltrehalose trehalohydrolase
MTEFSVWAPGAETVELVLENQRLAMRPAGGWWNIDAPGAAAGTRYQYSVNNGPPMPDPRSGSQPEGVHGPSELVDHSAFPWTDELWRGFHLPSAVVYELHIGTFTPVGTFDAAIERLDHLVELGIDAIEIMPPVEFPGSRGWGYDGVDLYAPHHAYGGPDGLKRLIDACHARGIGVIIDVVYNHLGPDGDYLPQYAPYFTEKYQTPWGDGVNFDGPASDGVREFVIDNALMWLRDYHADGLRLDAVHAIFDGSATHIVEAVAEEVWRLSLALGRYLFVIAESDLNDPRVVRSRQAGGYGVDAQWNDDFHHALHALLTGERSGYYVDFGGIDPLVQVLQKNFFHDGRYSEFRDREYGRAADDMSPSSFVVYSQNHDQIGNRARGDRLSMLVSADRLKVAAGLVLLSPFVPMLFQGEEWGASTPFQYFTDHDPELGKLVSEGRKREFAPFGWSPDDIPDPQLESTFSDSTLNWEELKHSDHAELLAWYKALIMLRRSEPSLRQGREERFSVDSSQPGMIAMRRGDLVIVVNVRDESTTYAVDGAEIVIASPAEVRLTREGAHLPADSIAVLRL